MSRNKSRDPRRAEPGRGGAENTMEEERFAPAGVRLMICGVATLAAGFLVLSKADPMGRNWAGSLSPFLILGGYALVGLGVFWREGETPSAPPAVRPPGA